MRNRSHVVEELRVNRPFVVLVPKLEAVFSKVKLEIGDKFTTTVKDELLCCPLLLLTFKLAVVDEIGLLYETK